MIVILNQRWMFKNPKYKNLGEVVCLLAERSDTKSNVKLGVFKPQLQASYVSSHSKEL